MMSIKKTTSIINDNVYGTKNERNSTFETTLSSLIRGRITSKENNNLKKGAAKNKTLNSLFVCFLTNIPTSKQ